jgi:hypothetical protein
MISIKETEAVYKDNKGLALEPLNHSRADPGCPFTIFKYFFRFLNIDIASPICIENKVTQRLVISQVYKRKECRELLDCCGSLSLVIRFEPKQY